MEQIGCEASAGRQRHIAARCEDGSLVTAQLGDGEQHRGGRGRNVPTLDWPPQVAPAAAARRSPVRRTTPRSAAASSSVVP